MDMVSTIMADSTIAREAEAYLGLLGVTCILPQLWEVVLFEMSMGPQEGQQWTKRTVARRYLEYLRDHTKSSRLERL